MMNVKSTQSHNVSAQGAAQAVSPDRPITVLLVEDNPADVLLVNHVLESVGSYTFRIVTVERLQAAIEQLNRETPEVVLLDLSLPDSQGFETFTKLAARAPGVPIIVLSGTDDEELAAQAVRQGAQDYVVKWSMEGALLSRVMRYAIERQRAKGASVAGSAEVQRLQALLQAKDQEIASLKKTIQDLQQGRGASGSR